MKSELICQMYEEEPPADWDGTTPASVTIFLIVIALALFALFIWGHKIK